MFRVNDEFMFVFVGYCSILYWPSSVLFTLIGNDSPNMLIWNHLIAIARGNLKSCVYKMCYTTEPCSLEDSLKTIVDYRNQNGFGKYNEYRSQYNIWRGIVWLSSLILSQTINTVESGLAQVEVASGMVSLAPLPPTFHPLLFCSYVSLCTLCAHHSLSLLFSHFKQLGSGQSRALLPECTHLLPLSAGSCVDTSSLLL